MSRFSFILMCLLGLFLGSCTDSASGSGGKTNVCGDNVAAGSEQCDDGNNVSNDGCSSTCVAECRVYVKQDVQGSGSGGKWDNAFTNITAAVDAPVPNPNCSEKNIFVAKGLYKESLTLDQNTNIYGAFAGTENRLDERILPDFHESYSPLDNKLGANVVDGTNFTILDGKDINRVILASNNVLLDGLVVQNGQGQGTEGNTLGGGILVNFKEAESDINFLMNHVLLLNSQADWGGALYVSAQGVKRNAVVIIGINNSIVSGNSAGRGGGFYINGREVIGKVLTKVSASKFFENSAFSLPSNVGSGLGGAIYNRGYKASGEVATEITDSIIGGNFAGLSGGGIFNEGQSASGKVTVTISASKVFENEAKENGGGVFNYGYLATESVQTVISDTELISNTAKHGGALHNYGRDTDIAPQIKVINSKLSFNVAKFGGVAYNTSGDIELTACTVANNIAKPSGDDGTYRAETSSSLIVTDSVLWNNGASPGGIAQIGTDTITNTALDNIPSSSTLLDHVNGNIELTVSPFVTGSLELSTGTVDSCTACATGAASGGKLGADL